MSYTHISYHERTEIARMLKCKKSKREIARSLNRSVSTIADEIKRNRLNTKYYDAEYADMKAQKRKTYPRTRPVTENEHIRTQVALSLKQGLSPDAMKGRALLENVSFAISVESIYLLIARNAKEGGTLYTSLPYKRKTRKIHRIPHNTGTFEQQKTRINERPAHITARTTIGHCETDCIVGKDNSSVIQTTIERKSRFLFAKQLPRATKEHTKQTLWEIKKQYPDKIHSFTTDNGSEFSYHTLAFLDSSVPMYFTYPHCPWQKGSIEHANKLLRRYIKKGTDISCISPAHLCAIVATINNTPRKILGYKTPFEVFFGTSVRLLI